MLDDSDILAPEEAAAFLTELGDRTSKATLAKRRCTGGGPLFQRFGRHIRYKRSRLREYAATRVSPELRSTSKSAAQTQT
jgi:hypothetical protein